MICEWCRCSFQAARQAGFCSRKCRQASFRLRHRRELEVEHALPQRFAYADPPYPGLSAKYYRDEESFAGEVDHQELVARLSEPGRYYGWALSTSARALRDVLPICPPGARVCAWVKPIGVPPASAGIHNNWEPLIVVGGRQRPPGRSDWLRAQPARFEGELPGRKPSEFIAWLFDLLGMVPGDTLDDLFPGTGIVGRAWASLSVGASQLPLFATPASTSDGSADAPAEGT